MFHAWCYQKYYSPHHTLINRFECFSIMRATSDSLQWETNSRKTRIPGSKHITLHMLTSFHHLKQFISMPKLFTCVTFYMMERFEWFLASVEHHLYNHQNVELLTNLFCFGVLFRSVSDLSRWHIMNITTFLKWCSSHINGFKPTKSHKQNKVAEIMCWEGNPLKRHHSRSNLLPNLFVHTTLASAISEKYKLNDNSKELLMSFSTSDFQTESILMDSTPINILVHHSYLKFHSKHIPILKKKSQTI